ELTAAFGTDPVGDGPTDITVIGDSYTEGMELDEPRTSWVAAVAETADATVTADGASGTGFTNPGPCERGDYTERIDGVDGPSVVQGGLNDVAAPDDDIRAAACAVIDTAPADITIVGPPPAPVRESGDLERVDTALARAADAC